MKTVVICGSNKFAKEALQFAKSLEKAGVVVFKPHYYSAMIGDFNEAREIDREFIALGLTHDHFYKIRIADVVFVFNKDGYIGNSTTLEIGYAVALGKPIYALSSDNKELCRQVLFQEIISTPVGLVKKLK